MKERLSNDFQFVEVGRIDPKKVPAKKRKQEFKWAQQMEMPNVFTGEITPTNEKDKPDCQQTLTGVGVYGGEIEGIARVVLDPRDNATIEPGEILIAPVTDAGWTPLFLHAAGLVVEVGGLLSHGSVIAREYGLPAIIGVENATQMIKTGDKIRLNGLAGKVEVLTQASEIMIDQAKISA